MTPSLFHKPPANKNIFPKGWFLRQAQDSYIQFIVPYYTVARNAGTRVQFLEALYPIWFDRFPVTVESEDLDDLEWAIAAQEKVCVAKLHHCAFDLTNNHTVPRKQALLGWGV
jgi:hypothetical protein